MIRMSTTKEDNVADEIELTEDDERALDEVWTKIGDDKQKDDLDS